MSVCTSSSSLQLTRPRRVYLTAYLYTSSENMNSYLMSVCTSSSSLQLTRPRRVYLTAYLYTSSENMNSYLMSVWTSSCSLHLTTMGGISDSLSGHFIWKYELILGLGLAPQRSFLWKTNQVLQQLLLCNGVYDISRGPLNLISSPHYMLWPPQQSIPCGLVQSLYSVKHNK